MKKGIDVSRLHALRDRIKAVRSLEQETPKVRENLGDAVESDPASEAVSSSSARVRSARSSKDSLLEMLQQGRLIEAARLARDLTDTDPDDPFGWKVLGTLSVHEGDAQAALPLLERARNLAPEDVEILNSLGRAHQELERYDQALDLYREALGLYPDRAEVWNNQGMSQLHAGMLDAALRSYDRAIELQPGYIKAYSNRGILLTELGRAEEALADFERVLSSQPDNTDVLNHRGLALKALGRPREALDSFERVLEIDPRHAYALTNKGNIFVEQGLVEEAMASYRHALMVKPDMVEAGHNLLFGLHYRSGLTPRELFEEHIRLVRPQERAIEVMPPVDRSVRGDPNRRLRLGFVSSDFRRHSVAYFSLPVIEHLDRGRFEVYCYFTSRRGDPVTDRFRDLADHWADCGGLGPSALAGRIRSDEIDVLFDLNGHSSGSVLPAFAAKPAPVQITWIGYPDTTGLLVMDYRLVDSITDPPGESDACHSESLIRLPNGFLCYRPWKVDESVSVGSAPCVESGEIAFGSFNNIAKLAPETLDLWARIMRAVPNSRLTLKSLTIKDTGFWSRFAERMEAAGIATGRLRLLPNTSSFEEHLSAYRSVDIALDSYPYHGTTTTCEALFMGVPVVTLMGDRHVSRVGGSLLTRVGLPELIADSEDEYVRIAVDLASDRTRLVELRSSLASRFGSSPLCDAVGFTRSLESVLREMWRIWCAEGRSRSFDIEQMHAPESKVPDSLQRDTPDSSASDSRSNGRKSIASLMRLKGNGRASGSSRPREPSHQDRDAIIRLFSEGRYEDVEAAARRLVERYPSSMFGWKALGTVLVKSGRHEEAIPLLLEANRLDPKDAETLNNLGFALMERFRLDEAISCFKRAIDLDPRHVKSHINLGTAFRDLSRMDEALECYRRALAIDPDDEEAYCNMGMVFDDIGRLDQAVEQYRLALALKPDYPQVENNLGNAYKNMGLLDEAVDAYRRALRAQPKMKEIHSNLLLCLNYQTQLTRAEVFAEHQEFERQLTSRIERLPPIETHSGDAHPLLRLGFVSGDLRLHSVSFFLLPILERLDRDRLRIYCYSISHRRDEVTKRYQQLADGWLDCPGLPEADLARRIRDDGIDILFDLSGHTSPNALLAFAAKPAPIQITWIGYPNTTGMSAMDYRLVDEITDPSGEADAYHSERLTRLPKGFLCYRPWTTAYELEVGTPPCLDRGWVTFGSFNNLAKITQATLDLWVGLMNAVPDARLLLKSHTTAEVQTWNRLVEYFGRRGVAVERLEMSPRAASYMNHLDQYRRIDIALDTFPYHGTTTTCEALFMGVPVVTLMGDRHASRVGGSLLNRVGLDELIAESAEDYISIAKNLAQDPSRLRTLRAELRQKLDDSPLRDEEGFTRSLESVLLELWSTHCFKSVPGGFQSGPAIIDERRYPTSDRPKTDAVADSKTGSSRKTERRTRTSRAGKKAHGKSKRKASDPEEGRVREEGAPLVPESDERGAVIQMFDEGRYREVETASRRLSARYPESAFGWKFLATSLVRLGRYEEALQPVLTANRLVLDDAECINTQGFILQQLGRLEEAIDTYRQALESDAGFILAYANLGAVLSDLGRFDEALEIYGRALRVQPNAVEIHVNRALTLQSMGRLEDSLACFDRLLAIKPDDADTLNKRGVLLQSLGRVEEALASFEAAISADPGLAACLVNRGNILKEQGDLDAALSSYGRALELQPDLIEAGHNRLLCLNYRSDLGREAVFAEHRSFGRQLASRIRRLPPCANRDLDPNRRLRIGFVSGDFRRHSVAFFALPVLERLDRAHFHVHCYMTNSASDQVTQAFREMSAVWVEAAGLKPLALAQRVQADEIDILVDLSGHTEGNALSSFAARPAPVQVTWIGYPNTTGLEAMDYRLVDSVTDPLGDADAYHTERLFRLPHGFLCFRPLVSYDVSPTTVPRSSAGKGLTFGSFNNLAKISSETLSLWSSLLQALPDARLILKSPRASERLAWTRLVADFAASGIGAERLDILPRASRYEDHLRLYEQIDIALDTYPYNGTTTSCEALYMGVPVISLLGDRHASRVGASLLTQVGLTELIAQSEEQYLKIAVDLASDPTRLASLRSDLHDRFDRSALRDESGFVRILEHAFREMWQGYCDERTSQPHEIGRSLDQRPSALEQQHVVRLFERGALSDVESAAHALTERYPQASFGWKALGTALAKSSRSLEAVSMLRRAIALSPLDVEALDALGKVLFDLNRLDEARDVLERALGIRPDFAAAHDNLGLVLANQGFVEEAVNHHRAAIEIQPDRASTHSNLGVALSALGHLEQAAECYRKALSIRPRDAGILSNLANRMRDLGRLDESLAMYERALEIDPASTEIQSNRLYCLNFVPDISREEVFAEHRSYGRLCSDKIPRLTPVIKDPDPERRIRLGFVSADFRHHSVAFFSLPIIENLDRADFHVSCYSTNPQRDQVTKAFEQSADHWCDASSMRDSELAERIRDDGIDILFDLNGHTRGNALAVFAAKPAPVQVSWIGYPNTTGLDTIDYRFVDDLTDPAGDADLYHSESLIRLPHGFLCYRPAISDMELPLRDAPFRKNGFVSFGSFNALAKINRLTLDLWANILKDVPESKLLLKSSVVSDTSSWSHVLDGFMERGIGRDRLVILDCSQTYRQHLESYYDVDIALDTFPYHGTTTTCEALFMSVPVVSLAGDRHVSRVGVSLLNRIGLETFVAESFAEYQRIAIELARNSEVLDHARARCRTGLLNSSLYDEVEFTGALQMVLRNIWRYVVSQGSDNSAALRLGFNP